MSIIPDWQITTAAELGMIKPCINHGATPQPGTISNGVTSYGYDITLGYKFKMLASPGTLGYNGDPSLAPCLDPKTDTDWAFTPYEVPNKTRGGFHLVPYGFVLGVTLEEFDIPRDIMTICLGKSTYARVGVSVNITPAEPEWKGFLTVEIFNHTPYYVKLYPGEGIAQLLFLRTDGRPCEVSYKDKRGKYQNQSYEPTVAKA